MSTPIPVVTQAFDFDFRPATYWPTSRTREQLLSRIKGRIRRQMAAKALAATHTAILFCDRRAAAKPFANTVLPQPAEASTL